MCKISNRHRAFHFFEFASGLKKVTIKAVYAYMKQHKMIASEWRARQLRDDWFEWQELKKQIASPNN